jgi:hypothetical protein
VAYQTELELTNKPMKKEHHQPEDTDESKNNLFNGRKFSLV